MDQPCAGVGDPAEACPHGKTVRRKKGRRGPLRCPDCHLANRRRLVRESLDRNGRDTHADERDARLERIAASSPLHSDERTSSAPSVEVSPLERELERRVRRPEPAFIPQIPIDPAEELEEDDDEELDLGALDVDEEEVEVPPAIARRLAEAPVPAIRLKSKDAIRDLERRGQPTNVLKEKVQADYRSPWEGKPREGFTATQAQRAVEVLHKEPAARSTQGKLPGHTETHHR